jgi:hypothetical protein
MHRNGIISPQNNPISQSAFEKKGKEIAENHTSQPLLLTDPEELNEIK